VRFFTSRHSEVPQLGFWPVLAVIAMNLTFLCYSRALIFLSGDRPSVVLVVSALVADAVALWAIAARITDLGFSANRVAALGVNAILLINLAWSAVLYVRFLRGRGSIGRVERWQTDYLPVYAAWSALVVIAFPPLFGYA